MESSGTLTVSDYVRRRGGCDHRLATSALGAEEFGDSKGKDAAAGCAGHSAGAMGQGQDGLSQDVMVRGWDLGFDALQEDLLKREPHAGRKVGHDGRLASPVSHRSLERLSLFQTLSDSNDLAGDRATAMGAGV